VAADSEGANDTDVWAPEAVPRMTLTRPMVKMEPDHVGVLYRELLESAAKGGKPLSIASVQGCVYRVLHKGFEGAVADGPLYRNPLDRVKRPVPDRRPEMRVCDAADAVKFLQAIEHDRLYAMWFPFLATRMRRGEVAGLRCRDVNLRLGQIALRDQRTTVDYRVVSNPSSPACTETGKTLPSGGSGHAQAAS
jgi:integrase